ncbi:MAG: hypothetical protein ACK559_07075, partial [bacterium]
GIGEMQRGDLRDIVVHPRHVALDRRAMGADRRPVHAADPVVETVEHHRIGLDDLQRVLLGDGREPADIGIGFLVQTLPVEPGGAAEEE